MPKTAPVVSPTADLRSVDSRCGMAASGICSLAVSMDGEGNVAEGAGASACCLLLLLLLLLLSLMMAQIHVAVAKAMQNKKVGSTEHRAKVGLKAF